MDIVTIRGRRQLKISRVARSWSQVLKQKREPSGWGPQIKNSLMGINLKSKLDGYQFKIKLLKLIYFLITVTKKAPKIKISLRVAMGFI